MNIDKFKSAYNEFRNGLNSRIRHPLVRHFVYSDGVQECAEAGCYWLLDILGIEAVPVFEARQDIFEGQGFVYVVVKDDKVRITLVRDGGEPPIWEREIEWTDMPEGEWIFYLSQEGDHCLLILPNEY